MIVKPEEIMDNPNDKIEIDRYSLWAIWNVITSTPSDHRDEYWEIACNKTKQLLNESKIGQ